MIIFLFNTELKKWFQSCRFKECNSVKELYCNVLITKVQLYAPRRLLCCYRPRALDGTLSRDIAITIDLLHNPTRKETPLFTLEKRLDTNS